MRHLASKKAPLPLTHAEEQAMEQTVDHFSRASMNDAHSSMGGIAFALTPDGEAAVQEFASGKASYVQLVSYPLLLSIRTDCISRTCSRLASTLLVNSKPTDPHLVLCFVFSLGEDTQ